MNEGMMVKQLVKSEEPCWWRAVEGGHTISTRKMTGFSLQNQITKALCFFFSFLSHRPTGKKVPQPSPFSLPAVSPLPRQSGGQGHPPNVEWEGLSPRGGGGRRASLEVTFSLVCSAPSSGQGRPCPTTPPREMTLLCICIKKEECTCIFPVL